MKWWERLTERQKTGLILIGIILFASTFHLSQVAQGEVQALGGEVKTANLYMDFASWLAELITPDVWLIGPAIHAALTTLIAVIVLPVLILIGIIMLIIVKVRG